MARAAEGRAIGPAVARCIAEETLPYLGRRLACRKRESELAVGWGILLTP
jgi:hypothetical protein